MGDCMRISRLREAIDDPPRLGVTLRLVLRGALAVRRLGVPTTTPPSSIGSSDEEEEVLGRLGVRSLRAFLALGSSVIPVEYEVLCADRILRSTIFSSLLLLSSNKDTGAIELVAFES